MVLQVIKMVWQVVNMVVQVIKMVWQVINMDWQVVNMVWRMVDMVCTTVYSFLQPIEKIGSGDLGKVMVYLEYNRQLELRKATPKRLYMLNKTENS